MAYTDESPPRVADHLTNALDRCPTAGRRPRRGRGAHGCLRRLVDDRIAKTRAAVKATDVATSVVVLVAWCLLLLLIAAVAEHWFVTGGFSPAQRFGLFAVGLIGAGAYAARRVIPPLLKRVNPLYAAREIERDTPEIKNSLVNLLQLRERPARTARCGRPSSGKRPSGWPLGRRPDRPDPLLRAAQVLLALVAAIGVYVVASPKDFFATAGRVLAPWAEITPPTRVRIDEVEPGDTDGRPRRTRHRHGDGRRLARGRTRRTRLLHDRWPSH